MTAERRMRCGQERAPVPTRGDWLLVIALVAGAIGLLAVVASAIVTV